MKTREIDGVVFKSSSHGAEARINGNLVMIKTAKQDWTSLDQAPLSAVFRALHALNKIRAEEASEEP